MESMKWKYHYLYKTTNLVNGTYYIGMHSTNDLNDGYMGSGQHLRRSIRKHGRQNFRVEILEHFDDRKSLSDREREVVNQTLIDDPMCMNHEFGGMGGIKSREHANKFHAAGGRAVRQMLGRRHNERMKNDPEYSARCHTAMSINHSDWWMGKHHTDESKRKIGRTNSIKQRGEKNSQFGTCWITDGTMNKKVKRDGLELPPGWRVGRSLKYL